MTTTGALAPFGALRWLPCVLCALLLASCGDDGEPGTETALLGCVEVHRSAFRGPMLKRQGDVVWVRQAKEAINAAKTLEVDTRSGAARGPPLLGFGGAFTEAAALNWLRLDSEGREELIHLYFGPPEEGGHGYTLGRVHINSCDFCVGSYSFDDVDGDIKLDRFDHNVEHDQKAMLPFIRAAMDKAREAQPKATPEEALRIVASPWSPPFWMKNPREYKGDPNLRSMLGSAEPDGLDPEYYYQWALYIAKFVSAYKRQGVPLWGVTAQNEPEYAAAWEACKFTPESQSVWIQNYLGPALRAHHPGLQILGYDHNKDHVMDWAMALYQNETKEFVDGIAIHWYDRGLFDNLKRAIEYGGPGKWAINTEACNCPPVNFEDPMADLWSWEYAERLAQDMLGDFAVGLHGWIDWNLVLNTRGGPNHLEGYCDANMMVNSENRLVLRPSYHYMGHFSRFVPPGSTVLQILRGSDVTLPLSSHSSKTAGDREPVTLRPCDGGPRQQWSSARRAPNQLRLEGSAQEMCVDLKDWSEEDGASVQLYKCSYNYGPAPNYNQVWKVVPTGAEGVFQLRSKYSGKCITLARPHALRDGMRLVQWSCDDHNENDWQRWSYDVGTRSYRLVVTSKAESNWCISAGDDVMLPAVAFQEPGANGRISIVVLNRGERAGSFVLRDAGSKRETEMLHLPPRSITTFRYSPEPGPCGPHRATDYLSNYALVALIFAFVVLGCGTLTLAALSWRKLLSARARLLARRIAAPGGAVATPSTPLAGAEVAGPELAAAGAAQDVLEQELTSMQRLSAGAARPG